MVNGARSYELHRYTYHFAREQTSAERAVRHEGDSQLSTCLEDAHLGIFDGERKWRVLELGSRDRVDGMGPAKSVCRALRDAEVLDFPSP